MQYKDAIDYVYSRRKFSKSSSLERIRALLSALGDPQKRMKTVHIVGTNGKGSVSTMMSSALTQAGIKTGLFTSPFVTEFCERIQIDGSYIPKSEFAKIIEEVKEKSDELEKFRLTPTFFETVFAAAMLYFQKCGCEFAVIEAGIGGRDDSTNVIDPPEVCVLTSVSLDHTEVLGDTAEKIAEAKCGVIKSGASVVSFPKNRGKLDFSEQRRDVCGVIERVCREKGCELVFPNGEDVKVISADIQSSVFSYLGQTYKINFCADHQIANALCSINVLKLLQKKGFPIKDEDIVSGLEKAFIPARMETVSTSPLTVIDGGHNEGCMRALVKMIDKYLKGRKITALLGFMKDKDYKSSIQIIEPYCENIVFTLCDIHRGEEPTALKAACGKKENVYCESDILKAYEKAKTLCGDGVLICAGSFYLVSEIRKILKW